MTLKTADQYFTAANSALHYIRKHELNNLDKYARTQLCCELYREMREQGFHLIFPTGWLVWDEQDGLMSWLQEQQIDIEISVINTDAKLCCIDTLLNDELMFRERVQYIPGGYPTVIQHVSMRHQACSPSGVNNAVICLETFDDAQFIQLNVGHLQGLYNGRNGMGSIDSLIAKAFNV